jgi:hypothetical protein
MRQVVAAVTIVTLLIGSELAHAQAVDLTWITAPTTKIENSSEDRLPGSPLPEAMSLQALGDVIKAMAARDKMVFRGAQETAIYRNAAPAVVLLKTRVRTH